MTTDTVTITPAERRRAAAAGRHAALTGLGGSKCPFPVTGGPKQRILARVWVREYQRFAPAPTTNYEG